ncbi:MAG TPA: hypothetical protein VHN99_07020 [Deinococcales bacterium]|nr:hypothetical protein [Deinococcales bacterium]
MLDLSALTTFGAEHRALIWCSSAVLLSVSTAVRAYRQPETAAQPAAEVLAVPTTVMAPQPALDNPPVLDPQAA